MKNLIYILAIGFIFFAGCTGVKTLSSGLENEAYVSFIGKPSNYTGGVDVKIDDNIIFKVKVNKDNADRPRGKVYAISPGTHIVTVSYNNNVIFNKQIFVSVQETKKIILP